MSKAVVVLTAGKKCLKLLYNPFSGDKSFRFYLDNVIHRLQVGGYEVHPYRSVEKGDFTRHIWEIAASGGGRYDAVAVAGGDGSVNEVVNAMMNYGLDLPLGIIPSGTANDFANYLKLPSDPEDAANVIAGGNIIRADLGRVESINNDQEQNFLYFINVCGSGLLANISQNVNNNVKNAIGKLAYYLKGIEQIPRFAPIPVRITTPEETFEDEMFMFLTLNGAGAGGFPRLAPSAEITDGKLDFILFKAKPLLDVAVLFFKVLSGDYINDSAVVYIQTEHVRIEQLGISYETDVDGERGPDLPVEISCVKSAIRLFVPDQAMQID